MLCRTSTIKHRGAGVAMTTPLLIPSFSSKGFAKLEESGKSEIGEILKTTSEFLAETFLISAYDIFYGHVPQPLELKCRPELVVVDSGGYEVSPGNGCQSLKAQYTNCEPWTTENLESVINEWPDQIPAVFVSFDHPDVRKPFAEQIADARRLFQSQRQHLTLLLLKPEAKEQTTLVRTIESAEVDAGKLGSFDIIGVTEKELGQTVIERLPQIARLRLAMDEVGVKSPLHVFGALEPLTVCLYFIAGAEVFDGLKWLRYAYKDDLRICSHSLDDDHERLRILWEKNSHAMQLLQKRLRSFETTRDFRNFDPHAALLSDAYDFLKTKLKGRF